MRPRRLIALLHRYLGLGLMGLICLAALTGSVLVFSPEIDQLLNPDILSVTPPAPGTTPRPLAELAAAATAHQQDLQQHRPQRHRVALPLARRPDRIKPPGLSCFSWQEMRKTHQ